MTARGFILVAIEALLLYIGLGTSKRAAFVIFGCIFLIGAVALISVLFSGLLVNISVSVTNRNVERNENTIYKIKLSGFRILPFSLVIRVNIPGEPKEYKEARFLVLPGFAKKEYFCSLPCSHRGQWDIFAKRVFVRDVFAFFAFPVIRTKATNKKYSLPISVSPKIHYFENKPQKGALMGVENEKTTFNALENGDVLGDTRLYRQGDPLRRVHWVQSLRSGKVYIRRFDEEKSASALVILDCASALKSVKYSDISSEIAYSLAFCYEKYEIPVKVICCRFNGDDSSVIEFSVKGKKDLNNICAFLTQVEFSKLVSQLDLSAFGLDLSGFAGKVHIISADTSKVAGIYNVQKPTVNLWSVAEADVKIKKQTEDSYKIYSQEQIIDKVGEKI